jgi:hypothetical protein
VDSDQEIRLVGFESAINRAISPTDRSTILKQLDDTTDILPKHSVITFKRKIEPLLIHSCLTAKCHNSDAAEMPLEIVSRTGTNFKRLSQRNLLQVLRYTDAGRPLESDLLKAAVRPHAGQAKPGIRLNSQQFRLLQQWLVEISVAPMASHPPPQYDSEMEMEVPGQSADDKPPERAPEMVGVAKLSKSGTDDENEGQKIETTSQSEQDPFDPEIFNRNHLKKESDDANGDGMERDQ